jgi:hypothetical protein
VTVFINPAIMPVFSPENEKEQTACHRRPPEKLGHHCSTRETKGFVFKEFANHPEGYVVCPEFFILRRGASSRFRAESGVSPAQRQGTTRLRREILQPNIETRNKLKIQNPNVQTILNLVFRSFGFVSPGGFRASDFPERAGVLDLGSEVRGLESEV